tara:strand:+ start:4 stop:648 length:645 start_codon:yes stop_codon:yes gene_type:complete
MALINTMTETNPKIQFIKALQKAQKEFPSLEKSKKVDQGAFKYDYLPLEQMLSLIQPVLHNNGFHLSQLFGFTPTGETLVKTKLVHEDGHEEVSELPLFLPPRDLQRKNEAHVWGGAVTYQRRYSVKLILGLETDMDNNMEIEPEKPNKKDRSAEQIDKTLIVIRDYISNATDRKKLDEIAQRINQRYDKNQISRKDYNTMLDLINNKYEEVSS